MFAGQDGVTTARAIFLFSSLKLYAKCKMRPTKNVGPKQMMALATEITGKKFRATDYLGAAEALRVWIGEHGTKGDGQPVTGDDCLKLLGIPPR